MRTILLVLALLIATLSIPAPAAAFHEDECEQLPADPTGLCADVECEERALQYARWPRTMIERALACFVLV